MRHPNHAALFCKTEFIAAQMTIVFENLRALPAGSLHDPEALASALAQPMGDLNTIHPFREGNGRTMRVFIEQFARRHRLRFDQTKLNPAQWNEASRLNFIDGDPNHLRPVLLQGLIRLE